MSNSDSDTCDTFGTSSLMISDNNKASSLQNMVGEESQLEIQIVDSQLFQYLPEKSSSTTIVVLCVKCQSQTVEVKRYRSTIYLIYNDDTKTRQWRITNNIVILKIKKKFYKIGKRNCKPFVANLWTYPKSLSTNI